MAQARPKNPYKVVPLPAGYRRALPKEITPKVQRAAVRALQQCLPLGKLQATEVDGKLYAFVTEGHYDDHVTKPGKPIWHPGISTIVPIKQPQPVKLASQAVYDAQFINQSRMTGEDDMSNFEGEGFWSRFKRWLTEPASATAARPAQTAAQKKAADDAAASALVLSGMRGEFGGRKARRTPAQLKAIMAARRARIAADETHFLGDFGDDPFEEDLESTVAADECYDAVEGDDFGTDDFGDEFGASKRKFKIKKGLKAFAKGSLAVSTGGLSLAASKKARKKIASKRGRALGAAVLTGGLSLASKKQRKAIAAKKRPAPRPVAKRPVATRPAAARPGTPPRTTATKTDSPLGPSAPFDETMTAPAANDGFAPEPVEMEAPEQMEASPEVEAAMDDYEAEGGEETPETADEGSDTYDETAINGEGYTHSKYSIGA